MAKENISDLTTELLIKKKKTLTFLTGMLTTLLILATFLAIKQGTIGISLFAVALGLTPILFMNYTQINNITKELKSRN